MKKGKVISVMCFFTSTIIFSCTNPKKPAITAPFPITAWDYDSLYQVTVDSSTIPYSISIYDTAFAPHSQYSYMGIYEDSLVYTNYSVSPNTVKGGRYNLIASDKIVLLLPPALPDTFSYLESLATNKIYLSYTVNGFEISHLFIEVYTRR